MITNTLTYQSHETLKESFEVVLPNGTTIKQNVEEEKKTDLPPYSVDVKAKYDFGQGEIEYEVCPGARLGKSQFSIVGCIDTNLIIEGGIRYEW